jgi:hypothetical protein
MKFAEELRDPPAARRSARPAGDGEFMEVVAGG